MSLILEGISRYDAGGGSVKTPIAKQYDGSWVCITTCKWNETFLSYKIWDRQKKSNNEIVLQDGNLCSAF